MKKRYEEAAKSSFVNNIELTIGIGVMAYYILFDLLIQDKQKEFKFTKTQQRLLKITSPITAFVIGPVLAVFALVAAILQTAWFYCSTLPSAKRKDKAFNAITNNSKILSELFPHSRDSKPKSNDMKPRKKKNLVNNNNYSAPVSSHSKPNSVTKNSASEKLSIIAPTSHKS
ncbi:MAG: hypothetical protein A3F18_02480 [Legionellales bacterium RIFCSPHIGHO2_12_FULL_37_14]|nr:MAG: hypothetical protein A3F18_02480 [Legionellales bacterium RIFCSPHIGHO2_12_FULL_37_14]